MYAINAGIPRIFQRLIRISKLEMKMIEKYQSTKAKINNYVRDAERNPKLLSESRSRETGRRGSITGMMKQCATGNNHRRSVLAWLFGKAEKHKGATAP